MSNDKTNDKNNQIELSELADTESNSGVKPPKTDEEQLIADITHKYWRGDNGTLFRGTGDKKEIISKTYIKVIGQLMALDGTGWATKVEFDDMKGQRRTVNIPNAVLLDTRETLKILADAGFNKSDCKAPVAKYLLEESSNQYIVQIKQSGWIEEGYICPSFQVITNPEDNIYEFISSNDYGYAKKRSLADWQENVGKYAEGNPILILALCASLTGPILKFFPSIGGTMIHFTGKSSSGKSTALKVAGSVWGGREFIQQWRTTSNALEGIAEAHNDGFLILDELGQALDKDFDNVAYMLGNERGKGRMTTNAELKHVKKWRLCALSSGEVGIADKIEAGGKKARAGQLVRYIDIDAIVDEKNGIYNNLHGFPDGAALSNHLLEQASKYYGTATEEWVRYIASEPRFEEIIKATHEQENKTIVERFNLQDADGQVKRVVDIFALLIAVGIEASRDNINHAGILTLSSGEIEEAICFMFKRLLKDRGGTKSHEEQEVTEHVISFLGQHDSKFKIQGADSDRVVYNCLGYKRYDNQESQIIYHIDSKLFKNEICKGMNQKMVKKVLRAKDWLQTDGDGNKRVSIDGERVRFVTLHIPANLIVPNVGTPESDDR